MTLYFDTDDMGNPLYEENTSSGVISSGCTVTGTPDTYSKL